MALIASIREGLATSKSSPATTAPPSAGFQVDGPQLTYTAGILALASAALATDIFTLTNPVAGVMIRVQRVGIGALQTTAGQVGIQLLKRSTQNSGGTSTVLGAVPADSQDPFVPPGTSAANGVVNAYTANPTTLGTQVGSMVRAIRMFIPAAATAVAGDPEVVYGEAGGEPFKRSVLRQNEVFAINLNGVTVTGGSFNIWISWSEEADRGPVFAGF